MRWKDYLRIYTAGKSRLGRVLDAVLLFIFIDVLVYTLVCAILLVRWIQ